MKHPIPADRAHCYLFLAALIAIVGLRASSVSAQQPAAVPPAEEHSEGRPTIAGLNIRGFGDLDFRASKGADVPATFTLGQLDLFITAALGKSFSIVSEVVFEADDTNTFAVDVERLLLQYSPSGYFSVAVGRFHTAIGRGQGAGGARERAVRTDLDGRPDA